MNVFVVNIKRPWNSRLFVKNVCELLGKKYVVSVWGHWTCSQLHISWFFKSLRHEFHCSWHDFTWTLSVFCTSEAFIVVDQAWSIRKRSNCFLMKCTCKPLKIWRKNLMQYGCWSLSRLLRSIFWTKEVDIIRDQIEATNSEPKNQKLTKRLKLMETLPGSGTNQNGWLWKFTGINAPDLRPLFHWMAVVSTSDLNDLYRRVINRNNRWNACWTWNAPDIIRCVTKS